MNLSLIHISGGSQKFSWSIEGYINDAGIANMAKELGDMDAYTDVYKRQTLQNGLQFAGAPVVIRNIIIGIIVVLSVLMDVVIRTGRRNTRGSD